MSRIGKQPILIPENVEIKIDGQLIMVKGPKGDLKWELPEEIALEIKEGQIILSPKKQTKKAIALWGTSRSLVFNLVQGVTQGFEKKLEIEGVGYRAELQGKKLILHLGYSHPVEIEAPEGIEFQVDKNIITVKGIDKQLVGQVAAQIRSKRKPEPYKGKGIRYLGEEIRRKAGKKAVGAE